MQNKLRINATWLVLLPCVFNEMSLISILNVLLDCLPFLQITYTVILFHTNNALPFNQPWGALELQNICRQY